MESKSVVLGFSGGIDSQSAARRLRDEGWRVVALTINTLGDEAMMLKAQRAAEILGIEWLGYDACKRFMSDIVNYFCREYLSGRTPAPCTRCNSLIKWSILAEVADSLGINKIATGHYFRIEQYDGRYYVAKGIDPAKDQSYYLWGLSQEILSRAITPMGDMIKSDVKQNFEDKSESMGICFLRGKHYSDFLRERCGEFRCGDIVNCEGEVVSRHNGIALYTAGQRRGEGIPEGLRVLSVNGDSNQVVVGKAELLYKHTLYINECNIVFESELLTANDITVKIRGIGRNPEKPVKIERSNDGYIVTTDDPAWAPAVGQPLVFYRKNLVIGGGIVAYFN
ncbi:MAG: tRNA-specific 2-thiouridylase [Alistipes sp.]|nr:tRNA-specific 2-thiouridylase [Alistipes sp.]